MKSKSLFLSALTLLLVLMPTNLAFAGVDASFEAQVLKVDGQKTIYVPSTGQYIDFCGTFAGDLYYGETLVKNDPTVLVLKRNLPTNALINFNGGITSGEEDGHFCFSMAAEYEITVETQDYVVQKGDTLKTILRDLGGMPADSKMVGLLNGLTSPFAVTVGETLEMPLY